MAKLQYDKTGRLLFTKEMKREYTLLLPNMLPFHGRLMQRCFELHGYKCVTLETNHRGIAELGLKYVHNDTCYPALLVIGQFIDALNSGLYDVNNVALMITQTGGGCRASNYIHLLRRALKRAGFPQVPVVSLNLSGLESNPGFGLTLPLIRQLICAIMYGDALMMLGNKCRPYEITAGSTDALLAKWEERLVGEFRNAGKLNFKTMEQNFKAAANDFAALPRSDEKKTKVGVVGEIYVKFSPLGNNNLEDFLRSTGAEVVVPGLADFMIFKIDNRVVDTGLYGGNFLKPLVAGFLKNYFVKCQRAMLSAVSEAGFEAPAEFAEIKALALKYLGEGNKMGEGWLLTGEMLELIHSGVNNIVCAQPFGCLPNHVVGKGMIRALKTDYPNSNIVSVDYDPGATQINQENRIRLMMSNS
ncbi:MAG: 2-hydroxyacyl-CoA dehydratase [Oscillospiraceae bacterium]|jgi:predicted nucleotide-binding protein (sugar kinase/HSP70/actin superfamily)|nr:2-hydroxyacyl-CoA dehydratase [Oscillospiraceae bacterium]